MSDRSGPWMIDPRPTRDWYIINQDTGQRVRIGPVGGPHRNGRGTNYRDKAAAEVARRNAAYSS